MISDVLSTTVAHEKDHAMTRTITLTDRAPVTIVEAEWPEIASGRYQTPTSIISGGDGTVTTIAIRVRQHADGRAIVYGTDHRTGADGYTSRAGQYLVFGGGDLIADAIHAVGQDLCTQAGSDCADIQRAVRACLADLPAEVL